MKNKPIHPQDPQTPHWIPEGEEPIEDIFEDDLRWIEEWDEIITVPREQITFRRPHMQTQAGQDAMKGGEYYKRIKQSIQSQGLINPLVCTKEGDKYIICLGNKRFIIGLELGYTHFPVILTGTDLKADILRIRATYKPTSSDLYKQQEAWDDNEQHTEQEPNICKSNNR